MESFGEVCQCLTSYKDENNDFLAKTPGRHYLKQKIKINIVLKILLPLYALDKNELRKAKHCICDILDKDVYLQSYPQKTSDRLQFRDDLQNKNPAVPRLLNKAKQRTEERNLIANYRGDMTNASCSGKGGQHL